MTSLIDRNALIAEYDRLHIGKPGKARKLMVEAPEVDAEPTKYGAWEDRQVFFARGAGIDEMQEARCTVCGRYHTTPYIYTFYEFNYCPICGAKMDAERKTDPSDRPITCDCCKHWHGLKRGGIYWCSKHSLYMETGCEEGERKDNG